MAHASPSPEERLLAALRAAGVPTIPPTLAPGHDEGTFLLGLSLDNITHLDVDALDRRLRALIAARPQAERFVHHETDFSNASAVDTGDEATLDLQEAWNGVRPALHLIPRPDMTDADAAAVAGLAREYIALLTAAKPARKQS